MRALGIHHLTALDVPPVALLSVAQDVGCEHVGLMVHAPTDRLRHVVVTRNMVNRLVGEMDATGVTVSNVGTLIIERGQPVKDYCPALDIGAALGARTVNTIVFDDVEQRAVENLAVLADLVAERDLTMTVEFLGLSPTCTSIHDAVRMVELAGRTNVGLSVDLLHLIRTGGTPTEVAGVETGLVVHAQLCDGPDLSAQSDYSDEIFDRMVPGEGVFPISAFLRALPPSASIDVEVPMGPHRTRHLAPLDRVTRIVRAARTAMARA